MAIFGDLRHVKEDTVRVDMRERWTNQQVKFINRLNEFFGTFKGNIVAEKLRSSDAVLSNASLYNAIVYGPTGLSVDINGLVENFDEFKKQVEKFEELVAALSDEYIPEQIKLSTDQLSVAFDEKLNDLSSMGYSVISQISDDLYTLSDETWNRFDCVKNKITKLSDDLEDLSAKIGKGVVYKGLIEFEYEYRSFKDVFKRAKDQGLISSDSLFTGWMFAMHTLEGKIMTIEGVKVSDGDFAIFKNDTDINNVTSADIDIFDVLDFDVVKKEEFYQTSAFLNEKIDKNTRDILENSKKIDELSVGMSEISCEDQFTEVPSIVTSLSQTAGKISYGIKELVSSDVAGLDNFVKTEISDLTVDIKEDTNKYLNEGGISQEKISDLTSDLDSIRNDVNEISSELTSDTGKLEELSSDYHRFVDYTFKKSDNDHISSYQMVITDEAHKEEPDIHDKYRMVLSAGTLILEKIQD